MSVMATQHSLKVKNFSSSLNGGTIILDFISEYHDQQRDASGMRDISKLGHEVVLYQPIFGDTIAICKNCPDRWTMGFTDNVYWKVPEWKGPYNKCPYEKVEFMYIHAHDFFIGLFCALRTRDIRTVETKNVQFMHAMEKVLLSLPPECDVDLCSIFSISPKAYTIQETLNSLGRHFVHIDCFGEIDLSVIPFNVAFNISESMHNMYEKAADAFLEYYS